MLTKKQDWFHYCESIPLTFHMCCHGTGKSIKVLSNLWKVFSPVIVIVKYGVVSVEHHICWKFVKEQQDFFPRLEKPKWQEQNAKHGAGEQNLNTVVHIDFVLEMKSLTSGRLYFRGVQEQKETRLHQFVMSHWIPRIIKTIVRVLVPMETKAAAILFYNGKKKKNKRQFFRNRDSLSTC